MQRFHEFYHCIIPLLGIGEFKETGPQVKRRKLKSDFSVKNEQGNCHIYERSIYTYLVAGNITDATLSSFPVSTAPISQAAGI
jgi:hypothetical protein